MLRDITKNSKRIEKRWRRRTNESLHQRERSQNEKDDEPRKSEWKKIMMNNLNSPLFSQYRGGLWGVLYNL